MMMVARIFGIPNFGISNGTAATSTYLYHATYLLHFVQSYEIQFLLWDIARDITSLIIIIIIIIIKLLTLTNKSTSKHLMVRSTYDK